MLDIFLIIEKCRIGKGEKNFVLRVKSRHLEESEKVKGVATITLKKYEYEKPVDIMFPKYPLVN